MQLTQGEHLHSLPGAANSASQSSQVWIFISIFPDIYVSDHSDGKTTKVVTLSK